MSKHSEAFVGIDTSKLRNAIAIAEGGRGGEVRFVGEIDSADAATRKLVSKLAAKYRSLTFCYEAGPTGYGLYRLIRSLGHECVVAAPSLIPKKSGVRVKTNRRDAVQLAKLSRAGELTAVWVPDERHEAMRDLSRARQAARKHLISKRQQISSLMLRQGRHYPGKTTCLAEYGDYHYTVSLLVLRQQNHAISAYRTQVGLHALRASGHSRPHRKNVVLRSSGRLADRQRHAPDRSSILIGSLIGASHDCT